MTPSASTALIAATRFGYAPRPGELAAIAPDPRASVLAQLAAPPMALDPGLPTAAETLATTFIARRDKGDPEAKKAFAQQLRAVYLAEIAARINAAATTDAPLRERLTHFWSNHFTVSGFRPIVHGATGAFEREAIRPHITGRFADMLIAVERHPVMLLYLDNALSIGPDSFAGQRRNKGINENFGREILELHTLGVDGGYTQADVEALARILTGWSVARLNDPDPGNFHYYERTHEPGAKVLLGKRYEEAGYEEGVAALNDLAVHPATAHHVATKLARHFIADAPPPDAVARIATVFHTSGGNLARVTEAVVREEAAWRTPFAKVRDPDNLVIAACRVTGFTPQAPMLLNSLRTLDQPPFFALQPVGWPDDAASWVSPEAVLRRAQWCAFFAERIGDVPDPEALAVSALGDATPADTLEAIRRAPSRRVGLALLLASPEFQRR